MIEKLAIDLSAYRLEKAKDLLVQAKILKMKTKYLIFSLILSLACAHQGTPPGGPIDKFPPQVLPTGLQPPPGATRVPVDSEVSLVFSEGVERQSVEDAFFISPYPKGGFKFNWKGKRLRVQFPGGLDSARTYVLTIGTEARDYQRNRMKESFTLAFATGDSIDQGQIQGRVKADGAATGTQIWAYVLQDSAVNPRDREADYITQCGETGDYRLPFVAPGRYRLFAVKDNDLNRLYDPESDLIGICTKDVHLTSDKLLETECNFQTTKEDTTKPGLFRVYSSDNRHLAVRFDESILPVNTDSINCVLIQKLRRGKPVDTLKILQMYQNPQVASRLEMITEPQQADSMYLLSVTGFFDLWCNPVEPAYRSIEFTGSPAPDTVRPQLLSVTPKDSARQVPLQQSLEFVFSEALADSSFYPALTVSDTAREVHPGKSIRRQPNFFQFIPVRPWKSLMNYTISLKADSVFDRFGNSVADSTWQSRFTTLNSDTLAAISGSISDDLAADSGKIFLTATQTKKDGMAYDISVDHPGPYRFDGVFPGDYTISGFRDRDGNGKYSYGSVLPFLPSERFFFYADTISVRSRWPNEGNDIRILK